MIREIIATANFLSRVSCRTQESFCRNRKSKWNFERDLLFNPDGVSHDWLG